MSCSGLHCAGCASGAAVPLVPIAAVFGLAWVAEHLVEVIIVCGACGILALAAVVALMRWCERRDARYRNLWAVRVPEPEPLPVTATVIPQVTQGTWPAIAPSPQVTFNFYGLAPEQQAAVIRAAIPGQISGDITEE